VGRTLPNESITGGDAAFERAPRALFYLGRPLPAPPPSPPAPLPLSLPPLPPPALPPPSLLTRLPLTTLPPTPSSELAALPMPQRHKLHVKAKD
jgi:hypothetical protein